LVRITTPIPQFDREWILNSNQDVFNNDMILKAKQNGIVAEVAHSHSFEKGKLNSDIVSTIPFRTICRIWREIQITP
jgi:hypothetical protein